MKPAATLFTLALAVSAMADDATQPEDLLRFSNDDQLHGHFQGFENDRVAWQKNDIAAPIQVDAASVRQIVLHNGRPLRGIESSSYARLVGGDRVPGTIVSLDESNLTLETPFAGRLTIPRNHIDTLFPVPFGGRVRYAGPFTADGWRIIEQKKENEEKAEDKTAEDNDADKNDAPGNEKQSNDAEKKETPENPPAWVFTRTAWYSAPANTNANRARIQLLGGNMNHPNKSGKAPALPLVLENVLGDAASIRFHLSWKNQLGIYIAFQADLATPPAQKDPEKERALRITRSTNSLPYKFGNCYVLALTGNYGMIYSFGFDKEGRPFSKRLQSTSFGNRSASSNESDIELRFDRRNGRILLFIDGEFRTQLEEDPGEWTGKGSAIGFLIANSVCQARISDVLVTDWNGKIDSARSMEDDSRDIVLLTNGTDRFSGEIQSIAVGVLSIKGNYATMRAPIEQVSEIHFARKSLADPPKPTSSEISLKLHPLGAISGKPLRATNKSFFISSPHFGETEIQLDFVNILDLQSSTNFIDEWDIEF